MPSSKFRHKVNSPNKPKICKVPPKPPKPIIPGPPPTPFAPNLFDMHTHYIGDPGPGPIDTEATYQMDNGGSGWYWTGWGGNPTETHVVYNFFADDVAETLDLDVFLYAADWSWMVTAFKYGFPLNWGTSTAYDIFVWDYIDVPGELHAEFTF